MGVSNNKILAGVWVKIIKESETSGLLGAQLKVVSAEKDYVVVDAIGNRVKFKREEVIPLSFREKWGIDKLPTLYHGTDLKFVSLPDQARNNYLELCKLLINSLSEFYMPYILQEGDNKFNLFSDEQKKQHPILIDRIKDAMNNLLMMKISEEWQYGDLYLTSNKRIACMYAHNAFAGGELGFTAYHLIRGAELLGVDFSSNENMNIISALKLFAEKETQPAIFSFDDLSPEYLRSDTGGSLQSCIKEGRFILHSFRYIQPVKLDPSKAELLDKDLNKALQSLE